ncbi:TRAP transporter large permease subunit [Candidatus Saganbacteria bacterium]|nr:TRAP transporter large permease subunit [Candidatus Saganbacteria bacterium]
MSPKYLALLIFASAYVLFLCFPQKRAHLAAGGALLLLLTGVVSPNQAFSSINWNVMLIFIGTLMVAEAFMESRVPAHLAEILVDRSNNTVWAILSVCILTGVISAFVENVAAVMIVAPIALALAKKLKLNPTNILIAIAVTSNLQGTATLIGDPPSMLLGSFAHLSFNDFFFFRGRPGIFFVVETGAIVSFLVLFLIFRRQREKVQLLRVVRVKSWVPTFILIGLIAALATTSLYDRDFAYSSGGLCLLAGIFSLIYQVLSGGGSFVEKTKKLDWETAGLLAGIFVLVGAVVSTGWTEDLAVFLSGLVGRNIFLGYTALVFFSVLVSGFIDNIPFLVAMLPVAVSLAERLNTSPYLFLFGLLIGCSVGGNLTPIGASANIVTCNILKREGYPVTFSAFMRIGVPFTLAAVSAAYLFLWFVWR